MNEKIEDLPNLQKLDDVLNKELATTSAYLSRILMTKNETSTRAIFRANTMIETLLNDPNISLVGEIERLEYTADYGSSYRQRVIRLEKEIDSMKDNISIDPKLAYSLSAASGQAAGTHHSSIHYTNDFHRAPSPSINRPPSVNFNRPGSAMSGHVDVAQTMPIMNQSSYGRRSRSPSFYPPTRADTPSMAATVESVSRNTHRSASPFAQPMEQQSRAFIASRHESLRDTMRSAENQLLASFKNSHRPPTPKLSDEIQRSHGGTGWLRGKAAGYDFDMTARTTAFMEQKTQDGSASLHGSLLYDEEPYQPSPSRFASPEVAMEYLRRTSVSSRPGTNSSLRASALGDSFRSGRYLPNDIHRSISPGGSTATYY